MRFPARGVWVALLATASCEQILSLHERSEATGDKGLYANGRISFEISLNPAETWHCCLLYDLFDGQTKHASPRHCIAESRASEHAESLEAWQHAVLKIRTSNEKFYRCFTQGVADMAALRLPINGTGQMVFIPAAGSSSRSNRGRVASARTISSRRWSP